MYTLHLVEPTTGIILNSDGGLWRKDQELNYQKTFECLEDVLAEKDKLLGAVEL